MGKSRRTARQSNFELLRIISMIIIVFSHLAISSGVDFSTQDYSFNRIWFSIIASGGKIGVNLFLFISAYFLCDDYKVFNVGKILKLVLTCSFYSVVFYVCRILITGEPLGLMEFITCFINPLSNNWWFIKFYLILFILHPLVNVVLRAIPIKFIPLVVVGLYALSPFVDHIAWFLLLYVLAYYMKNKMQTYSLKTAVVLFFVSLVLALLQPFVITLIQNRDTALLPILYYCIGEFNPLMLAVSVCVFIIAAKSKPFYSKTVNAVAGLGISTYIIHTHHWFSEVLWHDLFPIQNHLHSPTFWAYSIGVTLLIFAGSLVAEFVRVNTVDRLFSPLYEKLKTSKIGTLEIPHEIRAVSAPVEEKDAEKQDETVDKDGFPAYNKEDPNGERKERR